MAEKFAVQFDKDGYIKIGALTKTRRFSRKEEATDEVMAALAEYTLHTFDGDMQVAFPHLGLLMEVQVTEIRPEQTPVEDEENQP